jgi:nucleolar pre-ribosomal-associated protein 1
MVREFGLTSCLGIQTLKKFLDGFADPKDHNAHGIFILREYLESQNSANDEDEAELFLSDIMQTWSFASQSNDDSLLSAVPAVLALLFRTISTILEFTEFGMKLARTLLLKRQQELMARGLTANKTKEFVISPVLRLLKELSIFDGGVFAKQVFRARDQTFKGLARNLGLRYTGDGVEDPKKPSVRTNALRFVLSSIKFLPTEAKRELLNQRDIASALTKDIRDDPPFMVCDILETLKSHVLLDTKLPRDAKVKLVNASSLGRIAMLYRYDQPDDNPITAKTPVEEVAHKFLVLACTSPEVGLMNRQTGFYPRGIDPDDVRGVEPDESFIDLGLDSIEWMDKYTEKVPVRNTILSDFIQSLRPWSSSKQSELLLSIFKSAPELFADYYLGKKDFSFDPKLTSTWMGYSAFIFASLQLPLPDYLGHQERFARLPPPPAVVLESILPQPLSQKVLTRCLTQPHNNLITFFAIRILSVAMSKFAKAMEMYQTAANGLGSSLWTQAADRLTAEFCQRCPPIKEVIIAYRRMASTDLMQREAVTKLLVLYFEVVPRIALDAKFGVSAALVDSLKAMDDTIVGSQDRVLRAMELENVFRFAQLSPGMRWFGIAEGLQISPFMAMLKLSAEAPADFPLLKLRSALISVVEENQIFQNQTTISALDTFILRLRELNDNPNSSATYTFLDGCVSRCAGKPIKYIFALDEISAEVHKSEGIQSAVSLLSLTIVEQWPYMVKTALDGALKATATFIARYLASSIKIHEDKKVIKYLIQKLSAEAPESSAARHTLDQTRKLVDSIEVPEDRKILTGSTETAKSNTVNEIDNPNSLTSRNPESGDEVENNNALTKWTTKEVDDVIEGGYAKSLIMLLSSNVLSIRKEAATNISKFAAKLKESSFDEKDQIWLLLCELVETARQIIDQEPLPTFICAFASHALSVLNDPLHCMYPKINKFLTSGPTWTLDKIPLLFKILDEPPSLDDAHYAEMGWLLAYMLIGLRTQADMAIYRKRHVFEKLFSIYNSAYLVPELRDKILKIIFRAISIDGGSTTLITRFSTMTWLQAQVALGSGMPLKVLMETMLESCEQQRVRNWSKGASLAAIKVDTLAF